MHQLRRSVSHLHLAQSLLQMSVKIPKTMTMYKHRDMKKSYQGASNSESTNSKSFRPAQSLEPLKLDLPFMSAVHPVPEKPLLRYIYCTHSCVNIPMTPSSIDTGM